MGVEKDQQRGVEQSFTGMKPDYVVCIPSVVKLYNAKCYICVCAIFVCVSCKCNICIGYVYEPMWQHTIFSACYTLYLSGLLKWPVYPLLLLYILIYTYLPIIAHNHAGAGADAT